MKSWVILARVEDDHSFFQEGTRLDSKMFREMVETYNPDFRTAPVISGYDRKSGTGGPAHWVGEDLLPLGRVAELDFDGYNLWGNIEEFEDNGIGRVSQYVADGFLQRSIGLWPSSPEVGGKAYLKHVALLGGEQPGIPNMPPLDQFFTNDSVSELDARIIDSAPYEVRSILNPKEQEHMPEMNDQLLAQIREVLRDEVVKAVNDATSSLRTAPPAPAPEPAPVQNGEVAQLVAELRSLRDEALASVRDTRDRELESQLDNLIRTGRVIPADRDGELENLRALPAEKREKRLEYLSTRSVILPSRLNQSILPDEIEPDVPFNLRNFTAPGGDARSLNRESLRMYNEAMKRAGGDPKKFRDAAYALHGEFSGEVQ